MEVNPYVNEDKEQRRRVIIVATTIAVIILGIAVWSIIAIVGNSKKNSEQSTQVATQEEAGKSSQIVTKPSESEAPKTEGVSTTNTEAAQSSTTTATSSTVKSSTAVKSSVPETGPEEILPLALVLGSAVTFVSSKKLATREA